MNFDDTTSEFASLMFSPSSPRSIQFVLLFVSILSSIVFIIIIFVLFININRNLSRVISLFVSSINAWGELKWMERVGLKGFMTIKFCTI